MPLRPAGTEKQINFGDGVGTDGIANSQSDAEVAALDFGGFVVVYESPFSSNPADVNLHAHYFDAFGNPFNGFPGSFGNGVLIPAGSSAVTIDPDIVSVSVGFVVIYHNVTASDRIDATLYNPEVGAFTPRSRWTIKLKCSTIRRSRGSPTATTLFRMSETSARRITTSIMRWSIRSSTH